MKDQHTKLNEILTAAKEITALSPVLIEIGKDLDDREKYGCAYCKYPAHELDNSIIHDRNCPWELLTHAANTEEFVPRLVDQAKEYLADQIEKLKSDKWWLVRALKYYADETKWKAEPGKPQQILIDGGLHARTILEKLGG